METSTIYVLADSNGKYLYSEYDRGGDRWFKTSKLMRANHYPDREFAESRVNQLGIAERVIPITMTLQKKEKED